MRSVAVVCFILFFSLDISAPAAAQNSPAVMMERIETLERQLRLLQRRISSGQVDVDSSSSDEREVPPSAGDRRLIADMSARLGTLDRQIRQLTGRLEEMEFRQNQMNETLNLALEQIARQRSQEQVPGQVGGAVSTPPRETVPVEAAAGGGEQLEALPDVVTPTAPEVALPEGTSAERFDYAFTFIRQNDLDSGRIAMEQFLAAHAGDPQAANAKFWLGRIHMQQSRNAEAAQLFLSLIEDHPNHDKRVDALVDLSDVLVKLGAADDACNALAEFRRIEGQATERLKARARRISSSARCNVF